MRSRDHALERRVQFSRGHWQRDEASGAVTAGWWESVTVTWSPEHRPSLLGRALASAVDTIVPSAAEVVATGLWRVLGRRADRRAALPPSRRALPSRSRELPRSDRTR